MTGRARTTGFTLLETVIALALLAATAVVCLEMRAQAVVRAAKLREAQRTEETMQTLLDLAEAGLLAGGEGPAEGDPARRIVWRGEADGEAYEVVRELALETNPAAGSSRAAALPGSIVVDRITVRLGERTATTILGPRR